ncbi:MAG: Lrp/AsnC family transcriptional regulator [Alkalispirochaeta sp.]
MRLDEVNRKILSILQRDGSITNADLARLIGLAPASTLERVKKLEQSGAIRKYSAIVDQEQVGLPITAFVEIAITDHSTEAVTEFSRHVKAIPEVLECHHVAGNNDFLLKVVATDIAGYERFILDRIATLANIGKITTVFVLSTVKRDGAIPV